MRFLIFSDLHIHNYKKFDENGSRLLNCLKVLINVFDYASENGIDNILFCGDLFDQQKSVPTKVLNKTFTTFKNLFDLHPNIQFISISGNHDHSEKNLDGTVENSQTIFDESFRQFHLIDQTSISFDPENITVHGIPYFSHKEHFIDAVKLLPFNKDVHNILMIHQTPEHSNEMIPYDFIPSDVSKFDFVFCGHIHKYEKISSNCVLVGSPLHRDFGDIGNTKGFLVYDTESKQYERILLDLPQFEKPEILKTSVDDTIPTNTIFSDTVSSSELLEEFCKLHNKEEIYHQIGSQLL